jgi:hypothetical protein
MASILKHLRSSTANKRPTASGLADGQIAINTASGTPALFFKDSASNIVKVGPAHVGSTAPNTSPAGSAGNSTGELWVDNGLTTNGLKYYNGTAFVNLTPSGTTSTIGLVELATDAETQAGTDAARAVTPSGLQSKISDSTSTSSSTTIASSTAVKSAYDLANAALPRTGGTITGTMTISPSGSLVFEGATDDGFETTIAVVDPTADRTITLPNVTGTVVTTGDSGTVTSTMIANDTIVDADINSAAAITLTKLGTGALPTTITVASGNIVDGTISNVEISASAAIADTKLDTISTADKVSLSALNIDGGTDIGAALADADLFIVDDGGGGTNRKAAATRITDYAFGKVSGDITIGSTGTAAISSGVIVNADVNASAAIAGTKISPDFGSQNTTTTGTSTAASFSPTSSTAPTNGVYLPSSNNVAISTNGTGRLFVDASGNVGVGATPSSYKLDVFGAARLNSSLDASLYLEEPSANSVRIKAGTSASFIGTTSNHPFYFVTNNTERMRLTSAGLLGLGTSSPATLLDLSSTTAAKLNLTYPGFGIATLASDSTGALLLQADEANTQASSLIQFKVDGSERVRIDSSGRVGIGTTSPAGTLSVNNASANSVIEVTRGAAGAGYGYTIVGADGATTPALRFQTISNGVWGSEVARFDSSGRLLVGTTTSYNVGSTVGAVFQQVNTDSVVNASFSRYTNDTSGAILSLGKSRGTSAGSYTIVQNGDELGSIRFAAADGTDLVTQAAQITCAVDGIPGADSMPGRIVFSTASNASPSVITEAMRITNGRDVFIGKTASGIGTVGSEFGAGALWVTRSAGTALRVNRLVDDGTLVEFLQASVAEGTISVSGTTVSYNGAHLSRWSQLPGGAERTEILRGTVLSNIDEMCDWGEEENEQLNRMKVSDVQGDPNVSGVFQAWDDDDDTYTDDFYCAMTGDFIIRIAEGVTVQRGDLLMSAGDGTAKPQDDDIIRSKTIAKVTSTHVTCTYDDGSYCVPCVLMAC